MAGERKEGEETAAIYVSDLSMASVIFLAISISFNARFNHYGYVYRLACFLCSFVRFGCFLNHRWYAFAKV